MDEHDATDAPPSPSNGAAAEPPDPPAWAGTVAGAAGAAIALGFGELIEGATETIPSLVIAVGELVADYTPGDVVEVSIANLGSIQKSVLTTGIVILSLIIGGALGRMAARGRRPVTVAGFALFGLLGGWAAARNPFSPFVGSWLVALCAAALGLGTTLLLASRARAPTAPDRRPSAPDPEAQDDGTGDETAATAGAPERVGTRRAFFAYAGGAGVAALGLVGIGRGLRGPSRAEVARASRTLPSAAASPTTTAAAAGETAAAPAAALAATAPAAAPATAEPATTAPAGPSVQEQVAALDTLDDEVAGISSYISPNDGFYRIDTALVVPQVDPADWSLRFTGMVDNPYELTFDEILAMDLSDHVITLSCVSNSVGGNLVGNARWTGVPLAALLERAGVQPGADQVVGRSVDDWTAGFPTPVVHDGRNAILAVGMNGELLPTRHGFPARLVVAGLYGYVSAVKWINEIHLATWDGFDGYWVPRGWSKEGPMKTQSRIDVPSGSGGLAAGSPTPIAGIAWAPTRGIERVEVSIDDEGWLPCRLGEALGDESWVQWHYEWTPTAGRHRIQVRATDGDGATQGPGPVSPAPNGAEGWHAITVNVGA